MVINRFFLITPSGRTGSKWVGSILRQSNQIRYENEALKSDYSPRGTSSSPPKIKTISNVFDWLESKQYSLHERTSKIRAVGFKPSGPNVPSNCFIEWFNSKDYKPTKIIYLHRQNILNVVISLAKLLNKYENEKRLLEINETFGIKILSNEQIIVQDIDLLISGLNALGKKNEKLLKTVMSFNLPVLPLCYETLLENGDTEFRKLFSFLNAEMPKLKTDLSTRRNPVLKYSEIIKNWEETSKHLIKNDYISSFLKI